MRDSGLILPKDNIIPLFRAGAEPPDDNWLSRLEKGTRFLAKRKGQTPSPELGDFVVASDPTQMKAVFLGYDMNNPTGGFRFVDPVVFSKQYELYDIIQTQVMKEEQENGDGNPIPTE